MSFGAHVLVVIGVLINGVDLNLGTYAVVGVSDYATMLLSKPILRFLLGIEDEIASAFAELRTVFPTARLSKESDSCVVGCFVSHGLCVTGMNMILRSYCCCILTTLELVIYITIYNFK